jgi:hypothetical protein
MTTYSVLLNGVPVYVTEDRAEADDMLCILQADEIKQID